MSVPAPYFLYFSFFLLTVKKIISRRSDFFNSKPALFKEGGSHFLKTVIQHYASVARSEKNQGFRNVTGDVSIRITMGQMSENRQTIHE